MKKLIQGILKFRKKLTQEKRDAFAKLALQQTPDALFIGCSDSRVVPNLFASTDPGDLFVLRNIGNLVPPVSSQDNSVASAIEFSLLSLQVSDIIVCGHSECGAMKALSDGVDSMKCPHIQSWLVYGEKARELNDVLDPSLTIDNQISQANVLLQMDHIREYPLVQERIKAKQLRIHGWWFDIAKADVYSYDEDLHQFVLIDEKLAKELLKH